MKIFGLVFVVLSLGISASADVGDVSKLPAGITCRSMALDREVRGFDIVGLNTETPDSDILDTGLSVFKTDGVLTKLSFSNECDNGYDLVFYSQDLWNLRSGDASSITGLLRYSNADLPEHTVSVTCTLP